MAAKTKIEWAHTAYHRTAHVLHFPFYVASRAYWWRRHWGDPWRQCFGIAVTQWQLYWWAIGVFLGED